jgi:uncharacterized membrane protein
VDQGAPRAAHYVAAGLLALLGIAAAAWIVYRFVAGLGEPARFLAPGAGAIEVSQPGGYVVWHEHRTVFEGRSYDLPARLPHGASIEVTGPDGSRLALRSSGTSTYKSGNVERAALAEFEAKAPGRYAVAVQGTFMPLVIAVGPDVVWPMLRAIGGAIAAAVIGIGAGGALALYAFLQLASGAPQPGERPLGEERERRLRNLTAVVYGLQAASLVVGVTLFAAVIVNYVKRADVAGTWLESHFRWQIRTFWWLMLWGLLGLATAVLLVGFLILIAAAVWLVYRIAKGWTELNDARPMYGEATSPRP